MGFFSSLLGVAGGAIKAGAGFLGRIFGSGTARTVGTIGAGVAAGELLSAGAGALFGGGDDVAGGVGGNGRTTVITTVQTIDNATGQVIRQKRLRGAPFVMRSDIIVAKRVFRLASKLHGRLPRKLVEKGVMATFKDKVIEKALDKITCPA